MREAGTPSRLAVAKHMACGSVRLAAVASSSQSCSCAVGSSAKLASNENPLGPSPLAIEAAKKALAGSNRYPDGSGTFLRDALAKKHGIPADNIILGGGSTELIDLAARMVLRQADCGVTSYGSFPLYYTAIRATGARYIEVPQRDYHFDLDSMAEFRIVRAGIGRKFQTPSIYENLSVFQNLEVSFPRGRGVFGALAFRCTSDVRERVQEVADEIGLAALLPTEAGLLSHGQKQWLEIGMLLMQDPELLMLDEPIAGMSVREREITAELLTRICQNRSMIVIEHDMEFVARIAHKVTVMHQGKILAEGPMDQVQNDPRVIDVYLGH